MKFHENSLMRNIWKVNKISNAAQRITEISKNIEKEHVVAKIGVDTVENGHIEVPDRVYANASR